MSKKILIVDDELDLLKVLKQILTVAGYEVLTAENGAVGLEVLNKTKADLIILDVLMPVMDGFGFFKSVKKIPALATIPILVLTARSGMRGTFEVMDADEFVPKPYETEDLLSKVKDLLQKKALVLSNDPAINEVAISVLKKCGYETDLVSDFSDVSAKGKTIGYKVIVAHLACLNMSPRESIFSLRSLKNKNPRIIVYSDNTVKGVENAYVDSLDKIKKEWESIGAELFFDSRIADKLFMESLSAAVR